MNKIGLYAKALATLVVAGAGSVVSALSDNVITPSEWIAAVILMLGSSGIVWAVPMTPEWLSTYGKSAAAGLAAGLSAIGTGLADGLGLSQAEIITAVIALAMGSGLVASTSNAASSDPVNPETGKIVPVSLAEKKTLLF